MKLKVLVVEDEVNCFINICRCLKAVYPNCIIDGPIKTYKGLQSVLSNPNDYDIIFSDIHLEDGLCFNAFDEKKISTPLVFLTAYDQYALTAFKVGGVGYLLKPIDEEELKDLTDRVLSHKKEYIEGLADIAFTYGILNGIDYRHFLMVPVIDGYRLLHVTDICFFKKQGIHLIVTINTGQSFSINGTLESLELQLDPKLFYRANRRFIVNKIYIDKICNLMFQKKRIMIKNSSEDGIIVSKEKVRYFLNWLSQVSADT